MLSTLTIDQIDKHIIQCLEADGRVPYSVVATEVGLTATAVGQRVRKLVDEGIIKGFSVNLDQEKMGSNIQAIVSIKLNYSKIEIFEEVLPKFSEVEHCYRVTGADCLVMKVNLENNSHLLKFINQVSLYGSTTTNIVLEQLV